jgi:AcrR family transcriptional regulator
MAVVDKIVNKELDGDPAAPPPRRRRAPEAARDNILEAAETMLIADGPQSLKLADVARAAGVSNASVLHHFGSIAGVQTALMEHMVRALTDRVLAITRQGGGSLQSAEAGLIALFDAFETRGAARLAAWLELTGEARRLTVARVAVREVIEAGGAFAQVSPEEREAFILACIATALGVGLLGPTLSELLGKPPARAREAALSMLLERQRHAIGRISDGV